MVIASAGQDDWILCQVTSNPYADPIAIQITDSDFETGSLQRVSYARPGKLFTANSSLMETAVGMLNATVFKNAVHAVIGILQRDAKAK